MIVKFVDNLKENFSFSDQVWEILKMVDQEFVPSLSARNGTKDIVFNNKENKVSEPHKYFEIMSQQPILLAIIDSKVAGFLSFRYDYPYDDTSFKSSVYVSTIAINSRFRGNGVAKYLYEAIEYHAKEHKMDGFISVRTWSTNSIHLRLLENIGYELKLNLPDDRGAGIDTVVVAKKI